MSNQTKHTPGPWLQTLATKYGHDYYNITGADGYQISVVLLNGPVDKANADLQTAAPELLAFAKKVVAWEGERMRDQLTSWQEYDKQLEALALLAKEVILKAEPLPF